MSQGGYSSPVATLDSWICLELRRTDNDHSYLHYDDEDVSSPKAQTS